MTIIYHKLWYPKCIPKSNPHLRVIIKYVVLLRISIMVSTDLCYALFEQALRNFIFLNPEKMSRENGNCCLFVRFLIGQFISPIKNDHD